MSNNERQAQLKAIQARSRRAIVLSAIQADST